LNAQSGAPVPNVPVLCAKNRGLFRFLNDGVNRAMSQRKSF